MVLLRHIIGREIERRKSYDTLKGGGGERIPAHFEGDSGLRTSITKRNERSQSWKVGKEHTYLYVSIRKIGAALISSCAKRTACDNTFTVALLALPTCLFQVCYFNYL